MLAQAVSATSPTSCPTIASGFGEGADVRVSVGNGARNACGPRRRRCSRRRYLPKLLSAEDGSPVSDAVFDVWQTNHEGNYENEDLGKIITSAGGSKWKRIFEGDPYLENDAQECTRGR